MPYEIADLIWAFGVPAGMGVIWMLIVRGAFRESFFDRYAISLILAAGMVVAVWKLELVELIPDFPWQWYPLSIVAAALVGPMLGAPGVKFWELLIPAAVLGLICGAFLIKSDLEPSQFVHAQWMAIGFAIIVGACEWLAQQRQTKLLLFLLFITASFVMMLVAVSFSFTMARLLMVIVAGSLGAFVGLACFKSDRTFSGFGLLYAIAIVGFIAIAKTRYWDEQWPLPILLLPATSPAFLLIGFLPFFNKLSGWKQVALRVAIGMIPLIVAGAWLIISTPSILHVP